MMLLSATAAAADISALELSTLEIIRRLVCAMFVGGVIGAEREWAHRPAGMRTDMMVCIGACAVMITSQQIFAQYNVYGATPDPARLSAQVIAGVGFLGAGTIMHEGLTVRGLTTAASLWVVACLGISVGGGYYAVALVATACVFATLTIFRSLQKRLLGRHNSSYIFHTKCTDISDYMAFVNGAAERRHVLVRNVNVKYKKADGIYLVDFNADFFGRDSSGHRAEFIEELCGSECAEEVHYEGISNEIGK
ncbi:MAG: MgtC/SapB family protein [Lachnospiraceae bacterium]|nr:MgtC/SapB family protein [Lachnospiraceae bacterium]